MLYILGFWGIYIPAQTRIKKVMVYAPGYLGKYASLAISLSKIHKTVHMLGFF